MESMIAVFELMFQSIGQMEGISVQLKVMRTTIPTVTDEVIQLTDSLALLKNSADGISVDESKTNDKWADAVDVEYEDITSPIQEALKAIAVTEQPIALLPHKEEVPEKPKQEPMPEQTLELMPEPKTADPPAPKATQKQREENPMQIGDAVKGMPAALRNLHTQYDNILKKAAQFSDIVQTGADKIFIQSGAAELLMEKIPLIGELYQGVQGPLQDVMATVSNVGGTVGEFSNKFFESTDFIAGFADGVKDAYNAAEGGLNSFNSYITTVKEIDTMVRTLTDAQKWAAFFTNIYTAAQSALNVVMNLSPWTIVIGLILALVAGLRMAWEKSESFRQILFGVWEVAKVVFKGLYEIGKVVFDAYTTMWRGIGNVILGALRAPLDGGDMFRKGLDDITKSTEMLTAIPDRMKKLGEEAGEAWQVGKEKGSQSYDKSKKEKDLLQHKSINQKGPVIDAGSSIIKTETVTGKSRPSGSAASGTSNGRNVNVRIESLVREIKIFNNIKESAQDIRRVINEELIAAVRDFEVSTSNG